MARQGEATVEQDPEFIVAEVSKNWPEQTPGLICQRFEQLIETQRQRGYLLYSFELDRVFVTGVGLNETIIAVFRREEKYR